MGTFHKFVNMVSMQSFIKRSSRKKNALKYVLIVGTDASALKIAQLFSANDEWGIKIVGLLTGNSEETGTKIGGFDVLGRHG